MIQGVMKGYSSQGKGAEGDGGDGGDGGGMGGDGGDGGEWGDREGGGHLLALFFFFICGILSQTGRSIPNEAGIGPEIFKY